MGISERKQREKAQRREDIINACKKLILEKGGGDFSLQDLANTLEISKAALYLTFTNKDEILLSILKEAGEAFYAFLHEKVMASKTGLEGMIAMAHGYLEFYGTNRDTFILFGLKDYFYPAFPFVIPEKMDKMAQQYLDLIHHCLKTGVKDGTLDNTLDIEQTTMSIIFITTSLIDKVSNIPREFRNTESVSQLIQDAFALLLRAAANPKIERKVFLSALDTGAEIKV